MQMRHSRPSPSGQGSKRTATTRRAPNSQTTSPPVAPRWSTQYRHGVHNSPLRSAGWQLSASRASATAAAPVTAAAPTSTTDRVPRGDTAGAIMLLEDVTVQAGERDLLEGVNWRMMPGQRVGLVGANGAGKSTLLKCLCGARGVDAGRLLVSPSASLGYLAQTAVSGSTRSVYDEVRSGMTHLVAAEAALEAGAMAAAAGDPKGADQLADAQDAFEAAGGYTAERTIANVLGGLGFEEHQWQKSCADFSGGWQMRIALARLLLSPAGQAATARNSSAGGGGLLLLDEPTNHLDAAAVKWLANFLATSGGSLVLVSHDEQLLEGACSHMTEVRGKKLNHYVGGYSKFLQLREERAAQAAATAASQAAEIARLEQFIARFGAKAAKAAEAQSKLKLLEKLKAEQVEIPAAASGAGPGDAKKVTLALPKAPPCYTDVIKLQGVSVGWGSPDTPGATPVLQGVNVQIQKGQRVLVLGPNGAGKSTLLKVVSGRIPAWTGDRQLGEGVRLAVFDQDLAQELPADEVALDYVSRRARETDVTITLEKCRQALGALGLTGSLALQTIGSLSGGEKARVALALFALVPANVLLLDEASNHLDIATLEVLTAALQDFQGAIVAITHNPAFAAALNPTHILRVQGGGAKLSEHFGPLSPEDFEHSHPAPSTSSSSSGTSGSSSGSSKPAASSSGSSTKASAGSSKAASSSSGKQGKGGAVAASNGKVKSKPAPSSSSTTTTSSSSTPAVMSSSSSSSKQQARKRTTLAYKEQIEYQGLCKDMGSLGAQRTQLEQQLAKLAAAGGGAGAAQQLEEVSQQLAAVAATLEDKELRWLELAELAGDL